MSTIRPADDRASDLRRTGDITSARTGDDRGARRPDASHMHTPHAPHPDMAAKIARRVALPAAALLVGSALTIAHADGQTGRTLTFEGSTPTARDVKQFDTRPWAIHRRPDRRRRVTAPGRPADRTPAPDLHDPGPQLPGPGLRLRP